MKKLILTLLLLTATMSYSQTLQTVSPTFGAENVPVFPIIILEASKNIDTTEFILNSPYDTLGTPQIYLINSRIYDDSGDSLNQVISDQIQMEVIEGNKIRITILFEPLNFMTDYSIIVKDLPLRDAADTTTTYLDTVFVDYFKVAEDLPYLEHFSAINSENNIIKCKDSLRLYLKGPIDTTFIEIDTLIQILQFNDYVIDSLEVDSLVLVPQFSNYDFDFSLNDELTVVTIYKDGGFSAGNTYALNYNFSKYFGDTTWNYSGYFNISNSAYVKLQAVLEGTNEVLPDSLQPINGNGFFNIQENDTLKLRAKTEDENYVFSHWESEEFPYIDGKTDPFIDLFASCENYYYDVILKAVYRIACVDTVEFTWNSTDSIKKVSMYGYLDSISPTKYTVYKHKDAFVHVELDTNVKLKPMVFPDSLIHEQIGQQSFTFRTSLMPCDTFFVINLEPEPASPPPPCSNIEICINLKNYDGQISGVNLEDILNLPTGFEDFEDMGSFSKKCLTYQMPTETFDLNISIKSGYSGCYTIRGVEAGNFIIGKDVGGNNFNSLEKSFDLDYEDGPCKLNIDIWLELRQYKLEVHYVMDEEKILPNPIRKSFIIEQIDQNGTPINYYINEDGTDYWEEYVYSCNDEANFRPIVYNDIYYRVKWRSGFDFTPFMPDVQDQLVTHIPDSFDIKFNMDQDWKIYFEFSTDAFIPTELSVYSPVNDNDIIQFKFPGSNSQLENELKYPPGVTISGLNQLISGIPNGDSYPSQVLPYPTFSSPLSVIRNHHRKTLRYFVKFSHNVEPNSLKNSHENPNSGFQVMDRFANLSEDKIPLRPDGIKSQIYYFNENTGFISGGNKVEFITSIEYKLTESISFYFYGPHKNIFTTNLFKSIRRLSDNKELKDDYEFTIQSRNPGLYIKLDKYYSNRNYDNCYGSKRPDVFLNAGFGLVKNIITGQDMQHIVSEDKSYQSGYVKEDLNSGEPQGINEIMFIKFIMDDEHYPLIGVHAIDKGNGNSWNKIIDAFSEAAATFGATYLSTLGGSEGASTLMTVFKEDKVESKIGNFLYEAIKGFMKNLICNDRSMGRINAYGSPMNNWLPPIGRSYLYWGGIRDADPIFNNEADYPYGIYPVFVNDQLTLRMFWITGDF